MSEKPSDSVLGSLPHSRPHRRSDKRAARPQQAEVIELTQAPRKPAAEAAKPKAPKTAAKPKPKPNTTKAPKPTPNTAAKPKPANPRQAKPKATQPPTPGSARSRATQIPLTIVEPEPERAAPPKPPRPGTSVHTLPTGTELARVVVKATAEVAEIGLTASARAIRIAVSRLPRP